MERSAIVVVGLLASASLVSCAGGSVGDRAMNDSPTGVTPTTGSDATTPTTAVPPTNATDTTDANATDATDATDATTSSVDASVEATTPPAGDGRVLVSFVEPGSIDGWSNVDDTVMGGVSASTTTWDAGRMVFAGDLSLENNGGFTSVRSPQDMTLGTRLDGAGAIALTGEGDGKTYVMQLRTSDDLLYIARFPTTDGELRRHELPLSGFEPVTRFLEPAPGAPPLDASTVTQLTIYLLDGQTGPFRLAVSTIEAIDLDPS